MNVGSNKNGKPWEATMYSSDNGVRTKTEVTEGRFFKRYYPTGEIEFEYELVGDDKHGTQYFDNEEPYLKPYRKGVWNKYDEFMRGTEYNREGEMIFNGKLHIDFL